MIIDQIRIPFKPDKMLGAAYNEIAEAVIDWVLIIDHDVLIIPPNWYYMCLEAIDKVGYKAGWITCMTNKIGCPLQRAHNNPTQDMNWHYDYAYDMYKKYRGQLEDVTDINGWKFSGMFILTHRQALSDIGRIPDNKFIGVDNWIYDRMKEHGYRMYIMKDFYVYHSYRRLWKDEKWKI